MFTRALVRIPGNSLVRGLTTANLGIPIYEKAIQQHQAYIKALETCGLQVMVLEPNEDFPDSTFIEDTALLTPYCAIITNPGASTRKGEVNSTKDALVNFYPHIEVIQEPGTVEAGDIMMVGTHFYIGLSQRTNIEGAAQVSRILGKYGLSASTIVLEKVLHLKTGVAYLENNNLVACGEFLTHPAFLAFNILPVDNDESYAANCIWINGRVLIPQGFPKAKSVIENAGYTTIEVDVSEFRKLDGGLSCLSLRF